jgi:hypothetical protein
MNDKNTIERLQYWNTELEQEYLKIKKNPLDLNETMKYIGILSSIVNDLIKITLEQNKHET